MSQAGSTILLVEDSEDDVFIMRHALKKAGIRNPLQVVTHGQMALDYFAGTGAYSDRQRFPLPCVVFLDLKLPYVHGFEVLSRLRTQETLNSVPIVVLTSSDEDRDRQRAYELGARSYLVKPPKPDVLLGILDSFNCA